MYKKSCESGWQTEKRIQNGMLMAEIEAQTGE